MNVASLPCPCCRYPTVGEKAGYEICPICFWEDDGQDDQDADKVRYGPNRSLSLAQARENFATFGACDRGMIKNVRAPNELEIMGRK